MVVSKTRNGVTGNGVTRNRVTGFFCFFFVCFVFFLRFKAKTKSQKVSQKPVSLTQTFFASVLRNDCKTGLRMSV